MNAACWTTKQTSRSWPYLGDSQELALCIGAQIKKEAFMACSHYLASRLCLCDCGWGWSWPHYCPAACYCCLHHHKNCIQCCIRMLCTHFKAAADTTGATDWMFVDTSSNTRWKHINVNLYCMQSAMHAALWIMHHKKLATDMTHEPAK